MVGLVIALLVAAWAVVVGGNAIEAGFLSAAGFLWYWHWVWTIFLGLILALVALGITGATTAVGSRMAEDSKLGALAGGLVGGGFSLWVFLRFVCLRACLLLGSYALMTAGTPETPFAEFDKTRLIVGSVLLLVGLIFGRRRKSSD